MKLKLYLRKLWAGTFVGLAVIVRFAPLWWAFTEDPAYLLLILVSWIPSAFLVKFSELFD